MEGGRRFTIDRCLGVGGFGEVYHVHMRSPGGLETEVALKILRADVPMADDAVRRLRDEGRLLARLNHPVIVKVVDLVRLDGRVSLVTEYIPGGDLRAVLGGDLHPRGLLEALAAVAGALDAAWRAPGPTGPLELIHRDVKPSNIRLGLHGDVKLLDFGIARSDAVEREARTGSDVIIGSLPYLAPERFLHSRPHWSSDAFSLGCILYEGLAGERFYRRGTLREVTSLAVSVGRLQLYRDARLRDVPSNLPGELVSLVHDLLSVEPEARPEHRDTQHRLEAVADECGGPRLPAWARGRAWGQGGGCDGPLVGQVLTEEPLTSGATPAPITSSRSVPVGGAAAPPLHESPLLPSTPRLVRSPTATLDPETAQVRQEPAPVAPPRRVGLWLVGAFLLVALVLGLLLLVGGGGTAAVLLLSGGAPPAVSDIPPETPAELRVESAKLPVGSAPELAAPPATAPAVAPQRTRARAEGAEVELHRGSRRYALPADVPPGTYTVAADFGDGRLQELGPVEVSGAELVLECGVGACSTR